LVGRDPEPGIVHDQERGGLGQRAGDGRAQEQVLGILPQMIKQ
jgi:hypothetical protein